MKAVFMWLPLSQPKRSPRPEDAPGEGAPELGMPGPLQGFEKGPMAEGAHVREDVRGPALVRRHAGLGPSRSMVTCWKRP